MHERRLARSSHASSVRRGEDRQALRTPRLAQDERAIGDHTGADQDQSRCQPDQRDGQGSEECTGGSGGKPVNPKPARGGWEAVEGSSECTNSRDVAPDNEGLHGLGAFVCVNDLDVAHVSDDMVFEQHAIAAE
jgi:hypothetical protein